MPVLSRRSLPYLLLGACITNPVGAQVSPSVTDRFFVTSDGVRLHYMQAGPAAARTIVFVPGWTMPAWIWAPQIAAFSPFYRVVAFDPRGQGKSQLAATGYTPARRGADIAELIARVGPMPVVIVGWSLGVLDTLAYLHMFGDASVAGLVLVDNSVGEAPAPHPPVHHGPSSRRPMAHALFMERFVRGMFRQPQPEVYLDRLTAASLRTPEAASRALLAYPVPRDYWREAIYATIKPVLYVVRPGLAGQAANLERNRPNTESVVFAEAGHALFVDEPRRFDALMAGFLRRQVWP
jgi:non-heme chloroperoxidase